MKKKLKKQYLLGRRNQKYPKMVWLCNKKGAEQIDEEDLQDRGRWGQEKGQTKKDGVGKLAMYMSFSFKERERQTKSKK